MAPRSSRARKRAKPKAKSKPPLIGRPLMVTGPDGRDMRFLSRTGIPPESPAHFTASEPFTVLGISPRASARDITALAGKRGRQWLALLPNTKKWDVERRTVRQAMDLLKDRSSCMEYRAFARSTSDPENRVSRDVLQRKIARMIVQEMPGLRDRQKIRDLKSGGLVGLSFLSSLVLLIVVLTLPVGGVTVLGLTVLTTTLIASWGPLALLPAAAILALGGLGAYYYKKHSQVFRELQSFMQEIIGRMEVMVQAAEDVFLLHAYRCYQEDRESFVNHYASVKKIHDRFLDERIRDWVRDLVGRLGSLMEEQSGGNKMRPEDFFSFLSDHPAEVHAVFEETAMKRITGVRTDLNQLDTDLNQGEDHE